MHEHQSLHDNVSSIYTLGAGNKISGAEMLNMAGRILDRPYIY